MKWKKWASLLLVGVLAFGMLSGCGSSSSSDSSSDDATEETTEETTDEEETTEEAAEEETSSSTVEDTGISLRLVNGKIEIDSQLKELAEMYYAETGITVEIESLGGGVDIQGTLKGYYQAGNMPDIFVNNGTDFENWEGMLVDMSDQEWASYTDAAYTDDSGAVLGFPYTVEAIGFTYNADILEAAGVDPSTLTSPDAYAEAFETIDAMKDELGLDAVVGYYAEPVNLYWSTGNHLFANYLDSGLDRSDSTYLDLLNDGGQLDEERFTNFAEFVYLIQQYSDQTMMISGTYDQQILNFASGKYAFVTQGSWIGATMTSDDAEAYAEAGNFEVGMAPFAFEDGIDTILTAPPSFWSVYADGDYVDESLAFLQWCSEAEAQEVLVMDCGFISPYTNIDTVADDPFAAVVMEYQNEGKTSEWHWSYMAEGLAQNATGQVFADFAQGMLDVDSFVSTMQQVIAAYYSS